jgi:hypothetical protein
METPNLTSPEGPALSQRSIILLRLLLLLVAAGAVFAGLTIAFGRPADNTVLYACPMHAEVQAKAPSACPICGMALEPIGHDVADGRHSQHARSVPPDVVAFENVRKHKIMGLVRVRALPPGLREIRGPSWATSDHEVSTILYNDQIESLSPEEHGSFSLTGSPKTSFVVSRLPDPPVPWDQSTSLIRFRSHPALQVGQVGWVQLAPRVRAVVSVPVAAILEEPEGPYVLVSADDGKIEKRRIEIGEFFAAQGFAVVLSGLRPNDHVVARATFFVDADRRLGGNEHPVWSGP